MRAAAAPPDPRVARDQVLRRILTAAGLSEAVTFGLVEASAARLFVADGRSIVGVANPLSAKFDVMRPSLLPGLVTAVAHNRRHGRRDVALFEIGACFTPEAGERRAVGFAWTGAGHPEHWSAGAREVDFFDAKGVVELLCDALGAGELRFEPVQTRFLVDGQAASIVAAGAAIGMVGRLAPAIADEHGAPKADPIFVAELDLDALGTRQPARIETVRPLPRFPFVVRDLSIIVSDALPAEIIRGTIQTAGAETVAPLAAIAFFDRYKGKGVPEGSVSVSVRLTFQAEDRTLTDAEVQQSFDSILRALVREHGAVQR
jgi:phenylalanyl-tRNA synthetase beta chain